METVIAQEVDNRVWSAIPIGPPSVSMATHGKTFQPVFFFITLKLPAWDTWGLHFHTLSGSHRLWIGPSRQQQALVDPLPNTNADSTLGGRGEAPRRRGYLFRRRALLLIDSIITSSSPNKPDWLPSAIPSDNVRRSLITAHWTVQLPSHLGQPFRIPRSYWTPVQMAQHPLTTWGRAFMCPQDTSHSLQVESLIVESATAWTADFSFYIEEHQHLLWTPNLQFCYENLKSS